MHQSSRKVRCFRSIACSVLELNPRILHGPVNAAGGVVGVRAFTSSNGYWMQSTTQHLQGLIVDALRLGERSKALSLLSELGHTKEALNAHDFQIILQCCARLPDPLFALETWKLMLEKEIYVGGKCYFYTIRSLSKGGYLKEASNLMSLLQENPMIYPHLSVCNNFLGSSVQVHALNHANDCLGFMEHQMVGKNEITYSILLKLAVLQQNLSAVHAIWKECIQYYSLNIISLRKFIWSFTKLRDLESAYVTLQYMVDMALKGNFIISRTDEGKLSDSRLDIPIPSNSDLTLKSFITDDGNVRSVCEYQDRMDRNNSVYNCNMESHGYSTGSKIVQVKQEHLSVMKLLRWSFSDVIHACTKMQNCALAEQLMSQMQNLGLEPSSGTYDGFLRAVVAARGFCFGMEVLEAMQLRNLKPYDSTLSAMSVSCSKGLQLDLAESFLDKISKSSSPYPYNAFFEACDTLDRPERAIRVLAKMKKWGIQPDIRTYELLFALFGNVNAPYEEGNMLSQADVARRINAIQMDMLQNGIEHSHVSIKNLLRALGLEGMIKELIQYWRHAEKPFSSGYTSLQTPVYNIVLHSLIQAEETQMAVQTFKNMKSCGVPSDAATYTIMMDCCSILKCSTSAYALVSMMIRDGFNPQTITYTSLIKTVLKLEDLDEVLKLLIQVKVDEVKPDLLLYNTILQVACEKGKLDMIEFIVEQMHQEKIQPDPSTCHYVFSAYVDQGLYSTAMEALQVLSMRMISEEDDILEEKRNEYENLIVAEDMEAEALIIEQFKEHIDCLPLALLQLRWSAMLGIQASWLPNESLWAKRLSHNYASGSVFR